MSEDAKYLFSEIAAINIYHHIKLRAKKKGVASYFPLIFVFSDTAKNAMSPIGRGLKFGRYVDSSSGIFDVRGGVRMAPMAGFATLTRQPTKRKKKPRKTTP